MNRVGRNDPCPCGSGKKYKNCCLAKERPKGRHQFKATVLSSGSGSPSPKAVDLMERTFGHRINIARQATEPPAPPEDKPKIERVSMDEAFEDAAEERGE